MTTQNIIVKNIRLPITAPIEESFDAAKRRLKLSDGELETLLEDERFDFVKPLSAPDGSLYCVKKPYSAQSEGNNSLGCAADILLLPVRLIKASQERGLTGMTGA